MLPNERTPQFEPPHHATHSFHAISPFPKSHTPQPAQNKHTCALFTKHRGYRGIRPRTGIGKNYFEATGAGAGSFAPSRSTKTWFNFALICPRSCAFVM